MANNSNAELLVEAALKAEPQLSYLLKNDMITGQLAKNVIGQLLAAIDQYKADR